MAGRRERWAISDPDTRLVDIEISDLDTVLISYELLEEMLKRFGFVKRGSGNATTAYPDPAQGR